MQKYFRIKRIRKFKSEITAFILFIFKKNNKLRLYVNYKALNQITVKNRYLLFLILKVINKLKFIKIFSKLNFYNAYYYIRIRKSDK